MNHHDPALDVHAPILEDLACVILDVVFRKVLFWVGLAIDDFALPCGLDDSVVGDAYARALDYRPCLKLWRSTAARDSAEGPTWTSLTRSIGKLISTS